MVERDELLESAGAALAAGTSEEVTTPDPLETAGAGRRRRPPGDENRQRRTVTYGSPSDTTQTDSLAAPPPQATPLPTGTQPWATPATETFAEPPTPAQPPDHRPSDEQRSSHRRPHDEAPASALLSAAEGTGGPQELFEGVPSIVGSVEAVRQEVRQAVQDALARFGVPGTLRFEGGRLLLEGPRRRCEHSSNTLVMRWPHLDQEARNSLATQVARALSQAQRVEIKPERSRPRRWDTSLLLLGLAAALLAGGLFLWSTWGGTLTVPHHRTLTQVPMENEKAVTAALELAARKERSCEAVRSRVFLGASVSTADSEGWVVEVGLITRGRSDRLDTHPALASFFSESDSSGLRSYRWSAEPQLTREENSNNLVKLHSPSFGEHSLLFATFSGTFVERYFDPEGHQRWVHLAAELASAVGATHAALYAQCTHDSIHALGFWFHGVDSGAAASSLLFFMGAYGYPLHVASPFAKPPGSEALDLAYLFNQVEQKTRHLERAHLATVVGSEGGMALGGRGEPVMIRFPPQDGNRSARASRTLSRVLGLAP